MKKKIDVTKFGLVLLVIFLFLFILSTAVDAQCVGSDVYNPNTGKCEATPEFSQSCSRGTLIGGKCLYNPTFTSGQEQTSQFPFATNQNTGNQPINWNTLIRDIFTSPVTYGIIFIVIGIVIGAFGKWIGLLFVILGLMLVVMGNANARETITLFLRQLFSGLKI